MAPTGNMLRFGETLNNRMRAIGVGLPHGIEIVKVADQSAVVSGAVSGFVRVLVEAVLIVLAVSFVSLGLRAGLVVAAAIPLVLAMTFTGMMLAGIGLQRISLGALIVALGLLVDDAMIAVETMVSRLEAGDTRRQAATYAFQTTAFPMLTGTLVMIAGFIPVGFASSSAGEYCFSLFAVVLMALLNSWVVAILFSPLTGTWLLPEKLKHRAAGPGRMARGYGRLLRTVLRHRLATLGIALAALGLSVYGTTFMQGEFFPSSDRPELLVSLTLPANASQTEKQTERLERALAGNRNIDHYSTYIGAGAIRFYLPMDVLLDNENTAQLVVVAKDLAARDRLREQLNTLLTTQFSDLTSRVSPLELGPPVGWPIKYRVSGPDYLKVREYAGRLAEAIGRSPLTREVNQTAGEPERTIVLQVNQTAARAAGVSSQSLAQTLNTVWSGTTVTSLRDNDRLVDVVLRANDSERLNLATLSSLARWRKSSPQRGGHADLGSGRSGALASAKIAVYHRTNRPRAGDAGRRRIERSAPDGGSTARGFTHRLQHCRRRGGCGVRKRQQLGIEYFTRHPRHYAVIADASAAALFSYAAGSVHGPVRLAGDCYGHAAGRHANGICGSARRHRAGGDDYPQCRDTYH